MGVTSEEGRTSQLSLVRALEVWGTTGTPREEERMEGLQRVPWPSQARGRLYSSQQDHGP